jgi:hypothetical protein
MNMETNGQRKQQDGGEGLIISVAPRPCYHESSGLPLGNPNENQTSTYLIEWFQFQDVGTRLQMNSDI